MTAPNRIAFIGNSLPRRCGIATFTTDLQNAVAASRGDLETVIVAMTDHGQIYDYPPTVGFQINEPFCPNPRRRSARSSSASSIFRRAWW